MKCIKTKLKGVIKIEHDIFEDERGSFLESYNLDNLIQFGIEKDFVQDNLSYSKKGVLRGLHFQAYPYEQGKLVRVLKGEVFDVVVDIRKNSKTFGEWVSFILNDQNKDSVYIPPGLAHGFLVLSEDAIFFYKCTNYYSKDSERSLLWNDESLDIDWPEEPKSISEKDKEAKRLIELD